jgi:hypothetical protein
MRSAHARTAAKRRPHAGRHIILAHEDKARAAAGAVHRRPLSVTERFASALRQIGEEAQALLSGGPTGSAPAAVDADDPPEAPAAVPATADRTAVYDIAAHAVYLPNGEKLEAHSGLGTRHDDPRYVSVKNRGPTPPNIYDLHLRESLFHGVRAIRLIPVDGGRMFGRDGILAHSYMHGADGQSNGCVVFRDYATFLDAFLRGDVERLVVVERLDAPATTPSIAAAPAEPSVTATPVNHFKRRLLRHVSRSSARGHYSS